MNFLQSMCGPHHLPPRLEVHQSWWAMRGIGDENGEWSLAKKLAKIVEAGYGGIMGRLPAPEEAGLWRSLLDHYNLQFGVEAFPEEPEEFAAFLHKAKQFGVSYVNAQVKDSFVVGEKAINRLKGIIREGKNHGIPVFVETHRGRITQDLLRTVEYAEALPDLRLTIDLSHYVLAGEMLVPHPQAEACFQKLLKRTSCIHGRVSNGQQIQADIGPGGEHPMTGRYMQWWKQGMACWLDEARQGDVLPFVCELGPVPYAIALNGYLATPAEEISDRWQQSLVLKELAEKAWREVQQARS